MKTYAQLLLLVLTLVSCDKIDLENTQFINDPNNPALKDKLKTIRETAQGFDGRSEHYYNANGYLTKVEVYSGTILEQTQITERNQKGQVIKEYNYSSATPPSQIRTYLQYTYDNDKLVKSYSYNNGKLESYTDYFYPNDLLVERRKYEHNQLVSVTRNEYDLEGRKVKESYFDYEEAFLGSVKYEHKQDTILFIGTNKNGIEGKAYYEEIYNKLGQKVEEAYLWGETLGRRVTNRYFYDEEHFLIESHHFDAGFPGSAPGAINIYEYYR
ncbi:MAG: hypothetical protein HC819_15835 [Cyclobacteriaceae bacterium]|nr:hypothetical protein [Cyclobacteriaceae bacterium]